MHLHVYRDRRHSTHLDLIGVGHGRAIDLVLVIAWAILVTGFALAILAQCFR